MIFNYVYVSIMQKCISTFLLRKLQVTKLMLTRAEGVFYAKGTNKSKNKEY